MNFLFKLLTFSLIFLTLNFSNSYAIKYEKANLIWKDFNKSDIDNLQKINNLIKDKKFDKALKLAKTYKLSKANLYVNNFSFYDSVINVILWKKYSEIDKKDEILFDDISRFIIDNPFYPNIYSLKKSAEKIAARQDITFNVSKQYFNRNSPISLSAKLKLLESRIEYLKIANLNQEELVKEREEIRQMISDIWIDEDFSLDKEEEYLKNYNVYLNEFDHINRIDRLLWQSKFSQAKRIMDLVNDDYQRLFVAIVKISKYPKYINNIILAVPRNLRNNEGLLYRQALWYKAKDKINKLVKLVSALPKQSQHPEKWWKIRHLYAREMLKEDKYSDAYALVKNHNLSPKDKNFWEAQWTSGWIALRFAKKPVDAFERFKKLYDNVVQPVTLSRASYWAAMSAQAMGDEKLALKWYKIATKYPIFFYGQLAIHKLRVLDPFNATNATILPKEPEITKYDLIKLNKIQPLQIAFILYNIGEEKSASYIFEELIMASKSKTEIAAIMSFIKEFGDMSFDVKISRTASKKDVFFIRDKFQIIDEIADDEYAPLVHAIVKQESGFAPMAVSRVGALGYMQLMPATAKLVAKDLGIRYSKRKLSRDIKYNVRLGSFYIKKLIDRFDGSELLAIASYNAGPNNAKRWINEFYDPRQTKDLDKVVDWIELITYSETRNYVQRIMENLIVYKYLMSRQNYDSVK